MLSPTFTPGLMRSSRRRKPRLAQDCALGLNSLRQTLESHARLAGHIGAATAQVNVAIQNNVSVDVVRITEQLTNEFDKEPDIKARIARAMARLDDETTANNKLFWSKSRGRCVMSAIREIAYRLDPALWVREVLGATPTKWQETFLRARVALLLWRSRRGRSARRLWPGGRLGTR